MLTSNRVQLLSLTPVFLTHLSLSCGGKGQEIREMAAEKLEGVAEKLADAGTATQIPTPPQTPEKIPADVSSITSLPTVPAATTPASVASTTPIPSPAPSVEVTPTPPTIPTTNAPIIDFIWLSNAENLTTFPSIRRKVAPKWYLGALLTAFRPNFIQRVA